ncbi:MAG: peroxiredoxin [Candidatus Bathyarchaeota archaeon]|nr:peroxiredoxin [Candidatus Bathyarchaeum tardum]WGM89463.1 MAG: peroxiredoxin [Candidatus Bathyarchaeum tardum]WNZ28260.1 MAG: peroxiredoxin [Candidatus Bathyarchaeota archaeon]
MVLVKVGEKAPVFTLESQKGELVSLSDLIGKKNIVLFFYPKDKSKGCTRQACEFRDKYAVFKDRGAEVIGISSDDVASHESFADEFRLPFILLSDTKGIVRKLYGVSSTFGLIPGRVTFVIDKKGIVRHVFSSQFSPKKHIKEALEALEKFSK